MFRPILSCLLRDDPALPPIIIEAGSHGTAERLERGRLHALACAAGSFFVAHGIVPGDRVATLLPTGRPLLQCIFGAWAAGAVITVLSPTIGAGRSTLSSERLSDMLRLVRPRVIIATDDNLKGLAMLAEEIGASLVRPNELPDPTMETNKTSIGRPIPHENQAHEAAFIQFTSGSTGMPKAVVIQHGQLVENLTSSASWTGFSQNDCFVSWLPLYHDFGFVIGLSLPIFCQARLSLIPTESFSRNPLVWLRNMDAQKATFTASPPSGAALLCRPSFVRQACVDLTALKCIWFGAEPISAKLVDMFESLYESKGLRSGIIKPAFGMAETTLTISAFARGSPRKSTHIDSDLFHQEGRIVRYPFQSARTLTILSNGPPLPGVLIRILDSSKKELPEGKQGTISISSSMVTKRYFGSDEPPQKDGWFDTGDLGFLLDGELYVTGRAKDVVIKNGANLPAHLIEEAVARSFPDLVNRAVAFSLPSQRDLLDEVIVGVEMRRDTGIHDLPAKIRAAIQAELGLSVDEVMLLPKGSIPRTTSGKLQRSLARDLYRAGELAVTRRKELA